MVCGGGYSWGGGDPLPLFPCSQEVPGLRVKSCTSPAGLIICYSTAIWVRPQACLCLQETEWHQYKTLSQTNPNPISSSLLDPSAITCKTNSTVLMLWIGNNITTWCLHCLVLLPVQCWRRLLASNNTVFGARSEYGLIQNQSSLYLKSAKCHIVKKIKSPNLAYLAIGLCN